MLSQHLYVRIIIFQNTLSFEQFITFFHFKSQIFSKIIDVVLVFNREQVSLNLFFADNRHNISIGNFSSNIGMSVPMSLFVWIIIITVKCIRSIKEFAYISADSVID